MKRFIIQRAILFLLLMMPFSVSAQQDSSRPGEEGIKIGLALSGGGAKGFAHIGVLKVFEEEGIPVHMISGTSMGSVVGSLYAVGYSPAEIEKIALSTEWNILFNDGYRINPQNITSSISDKDTYLATFPFKNGRLSLPAGLIDGQNISMMLYRLMLPYHDTQDFRKLPLPFSAVATNLATGKAHAFTEGYLPDAVRASIAIPTIFKPVTIDGQTYVDGGVARNIPVEDARKLGADLVIASDVGEPIKHIDSLDTFVDVLFQSVGFHQQESDSIQKELADFYLRPRIEEFSSFSYDKAETLIRRGEEAARSLLPELRAYLQQHPPAPSRFKPIESAGRGDTLLVSGVEFPNLSGLMKQQANLTLDMRPPERIALSEIEKKINRLYRSGLFSQVSYRLRQESGTEASYLVLEFQLKEQEHAGFSVRYDSQYKASLLFGVTLANNFFWSDRLTVRLRAGEILEITSDYSAPVTLAPLSEVKLGIDFQRSPIDFYSQGQALSTFDIEQLTLRPSASIRLFEAIDLEGGAEAEVYSLNEAVGNTIVLGNNNFLLQPFLRAGYSTLNSPYFPSRGQSLDLKGEISDRLWGSSADFFQLSGRWMTTLPLGGGLSLSNELFAGYSSGPDLPLHYHYYLGGIVFNPVFGLRQHPFMGHAAQQLRAANMMGIRTELQIRLDKKFYLGGGWNAAHLSDNWTFNLEQQNMKYGYSLSLGATSIIGPIRLSLSTPDFKGDYALKIDVGYRF